MFGSYNDVTMRKGFALLLGLIRDIRDAVYRLCSRGGFIPMGDPGVSDNHGSVGGVKYYR